MDVNYGLKIYTDEHTSYLVFKQRNEQVQKGLNQLGKGLQFCHNDAKIVHGNLVPDAIFVNAKGDWKIAG